MGLAWRFPFLLYALALPAAVLVARYFEEPTDDDDDGRERYVRELLWLLSRPHVAATLAALAMPIFIYVTFLAYNSFLVVRVLDGTAEQSGVLLAVVNGSYALATSQAGRIDAFFDRRATPLVAAFALLAVGMSAFGRAPNLLLAAVGCVMSPSAAGCRHRCCSAPSTRLRRTRSALNSSASDR